MDDDDVTVVLVDDRPALNPVPLAVLLGGNPPLARDESKSDEDKTTMMYKFNQQSYLHRKLTDHYNL